jgi:hypothetical protein
MSLKFEGEFADTCACVDEGTSGPDKHEQTGKKESHQRKRKYLILTMLILGRIISVCGQPDTDDLSWLHISISRVLTAVTGLAGLLGNILSIATLMQR